MKKCELILLYYYLFDMTFIQEFTPLASKNIEKIYPIE